MIKKLRTRFIRIAMASVAVVLLLLTAILKLVPIEVVQWLYVL